MELTVKLKTREPKNVKIFKLRRKTSNRIYLFFCLDDFEFINPDISNFVIDNRRIYKVPGFYGDVSTRWIRIGNLRIFEENERNINTHLALEHIFNYLCYDKSYNSKVSRNNIAKFAYSFIKKRIDLFDSDEEI